MPAINLYQYGTVNPDLSNDAIVFEVSPHVKANLLGNVFTYIGLNAFGDNYFGFRMGSVLCTLLIIVFLWLILHELKKKYRI